MEQELNKLGHLKTSLNQIRYELAETTDNYEHIIKQIDDRHRIIRCVDNIQYISQIRTGGKSERPWRSESFYMTKAGANRQSYPYREAALSLFDVGTAL